MRRHRIHVPQLAVGRSSVVGSEAHHLVQVLRVEPGAEVRAFDGQGREAIGRVLEAEPDHVVLELDEPRTSEVEAALRVTVAVSLLKGDKLADVVRQCTELGAAGFRPLLPSRRDVPQLSVNKLERLRRVAREAAKQSGRAVVPQVEEPVELSRFEWDGLALVAHPGVSSSLAVASRRLSEEETGEATIISGPEGGFSADEVQALEGRGAQAVTLGPRVLRAETAPVAMLAALLLPEAL